MTLPQNHYDAYHAHVYFDQNTVGTARRLIEAAGAQFAVEVGRVHEKLVGPHPRWSCQLAFSHREFDALIPWLAKSRQELTVFIHGLTGDDLADHTEHTAWLGDPIPLNLTVFENRSATAGAGGSNIPQGSETL